MIYLNEIQELKETKTAILVVKSISDCEYITNRADNVKMFDVSTIVRVKNILQLKDIFF